jgi:hypothetical protein
MFRRYAIKLNRKLTNRPGAICGNAVDADIGPELFLIDNWEKFAADADVRRRRVSRPVGVGECGPGLRVRRP